MEKHKHYQAIRAFADGWDIEFRNNCPWKVMTNPAFYENNEYRIVPDEDGWLPWYGGDCPLSMGMTANIRFLDNTISSGISNAAELRWGHRNLAGDIVAYKIIEEAPQPKKKVKMWQWIYRYTDGGVYISDMFYPDREIAQKASGYVLIQKADWTEIEVEES